MNLSEYLDNSTIDVDLMAAIRATSALNEAKIPMGNWYPKSKPGFKVASPRTIVGAAALAFTARYAQRKYERNTLRFTAVDPIERQLMTDVVDILLRNGRFKLHKVKTDGTVRTWKLKRNRK